MQTRHMFMQCIHVSNGSIYSMISSIWQTHTYTGNTHENNFQMQWMHAMKDWMQAKNVYMHWMHKKCTHTMNVCIVQMHNKCRHTCIACMSGMYACNA